MSAPHFSVRFGHTSSVPVWDEHDHFLRYDYDAVADLGSTKVSVGLDTYAEAIVAAGLVVKSFRDAADSKGAVVMVTIADRDARSFECRTWETPELALAALSDALDRACAR